MPEIAESMASKEDEDDFNLKHAVYQVPHVISQSQKIQQFNKEQSTPSPEKLGPKPERAEHPQKQQLNQTLESEQQYNSAKNSEKPNKDQMVQRSMFPAIEMNRGVAANLNFPDTADEDSGLNKRSNRKHNRVMEQLNRVLEEDHEANENPHVIINKLEE